ncbi:hypothetical protein BDN67DRAFT_1011648 [Paxillus ammoniavirescens]|nr:hypothetical protein BDN67DRAFT_1011648 [Paxillus ammoniavirescens]
MTTVVNVHTLDTLDGFSLYPLSLSVRFTRNVRLPDVPTHIPIKVSVQLPDELLDHIIPILEDETLHSDSDSDSDSNSDLALMPAAPATLFPFFPLSPRFNHQDGEAWKSLADEIQFSLVEDSTQHDKPSPHVHLM